MQLRLKPARRTLQAGGAEQLKSCEEEMHPSSQRCPTKAVLHACVRNVRPRQTALTRLHLWQIWWWGTPPLRQNQRPVDGLCCRPTAMESDEANMSSLGRSRGAGLAQSLCNVTLVGRRSSLTNVRIARRADASTNLEIIRPTSRSLTPYMLVRLATVAMMLEADEVWHCVSTNKNPMISYIPRTRID